MSPNLRFVKKLVSCLRFEGRRHLFFVKATSFSGENCTKDANNILNIYRRDGVVVRASTSLSVDLGFIP